VELMILRIVDEVEQGEIVGDAERAHGVPYADEMDD
jgi:hypothetical protein